MATTSTINKRILDCGDGNDDIVIQRIGTTKYFQMIGYINEDELFIEEVDSVAYDEDGNYLGEFPPFGEVGSELNIWNGGRWKGSRKDDSESSEDDSGSSGDDSVGKEIEQVGECSINENVWRRTLYLFHIFLGILAAVIVFKIATVYDEYAGNTYIEYDNAFFRKTKYEFY